MSTKHLRRKLKEEGQALSKTKEVGTSSNDDDEENVVNTRQNVFSMLADEDNDERTADVDLSTTHSEIDMQPTTEHIKVKKHKKSKHKKGDHKNEKANDDDDDWDVLQRAADENGRIFFFCILQKQH
jgi:hypothetical protein